MEFGELVEPETRSFWENYDNFEEENQETVKLEWKWMTEDLPAQHLDQMEPIERFYVFDGRQIFDFINAILLKNTMPLCQLENFKTAIYKLPHTKYVICLTEGNDINRTAQVTEMLRPWIAAAKETIVFSFQATYSYHSELQFDRQCFVRRICGKRPADTTTLKFVEPIEECNMISGVSAGVSTYCHMNKYPIFCYGIYIDCPTIDSVVSPLIIRLFNEIGLDTETVYVFKSLNTSNLYI